MTLRRWALIAAGLAAWAGLVVLWSTGPDVCDLPAAHGAAHCR